jgi:hypothetical protein
VVLAKDSFGSSLVQALTAEDHLWQQASAKQLDPCAAIHLSLQRFEPVDLSLHRSIAPRFCNRRFHRAKVLFQSTHKAI